MNDATRKRVMTADRLTLVIESQNKLIKAKDTQIERLTKGLREIIEITVEYDAVGVAFMRAQRVARNAIKEATNGS